MRIAVALGAAIVALTVPFGTEAQCVRHFYNNSPFAWTVTFTDVRHTTCRLLPNGQESRVCVIPSEKSAELLYDIHGGRIKIDADYWFVGGGRHQFVYHGNFGFEGCTIHHSGNTGYIVVNDPAAGDVGTCGPFAYLCRATDGTPVGFIQ